MSEHEASGQPSTKTEPKTTGRQRPVERLPVLGMEVEQGETKSDAEIEADIKRADARNALIAALDEVNPGNRNFWKLSQADAVLLFGENAIRDGKLRPGYEYKGLPIELEE